jgi:hypothetical protein
MSVELKDGVVAFLDILGFKNLLENPHDFNNLFNVIKNLRIQNTNKCRIEYESNTNDNNGSYLMRGIPAITSFSDCIVMSLTLEEVKEQFDIGNAVNALLSYIQQLADSLIIGGYILRGGITRGKIYHNDGVVFGKAFIEAYQLENSKAKNPRILISNNLAKEYNKCKYGNCNFLSKDDMNDEYCLDYLKLSFQDEENRGRYRSKTNEIVAKRKSDLLEKIKTGALNQLNEEIKCLDKWLYFEKKVEEAINRYET